MDFEFSINATIISLALTVLFAAMIWKMPTWSNYPVMYKAIITLIMPFLFYFVAQWKLQD